MSGADIRAKVLIGSIWVRHESTYAQEQHTPRNMTHDGASALHLLEASCHFQDDVLMIGACAHLVTTHREYDTRQERLESQIECIFESSDHLRDP